MPIAPLQILKRSFNIFSAQDPLRMAAATAFFTTFALPPILFIIIRSVGIFFSKPVGRRIFQSLEQIVGESSSQQIRSTLRSFRNLDEAWYIAVIVIVLLLFVATNLFKIISDSINDLWEVRLAKKRTLLNNLVLRWHGMLIILATAFLFGVALLTEGLQSYFEDLIKAAMPGAASYLNGMLNNLFSLALVAVWFALLFRVLPDAKPQWRIAVVGGLFTSILFNAGKYLLRVLLIQSNVNSFFGASAAFVLLLLFVFYTSMILYFGASFTRALWEASGKYPEMKKGVTVADPTIG